MSRVAIITGGSRGIGKATCHAFAQEGIHVAVIANERLNEAKEIAQELRVLGVDSMAMRCDVANRDSVQKMVEAVVEQLGGVDILVNNAGIVNSKSAEELSYEEWQRVIDVNLTGVFLMSQAVGRVMIRQGRGGVIINISSICGHVVAEPQRHCHYNVSKSGVIMLSKSLAVEWAHHHIRVNSISPGYTQTDMLGSDPKIQAYWKNKTPLKKFGKPEDVADLITYLASSKGEFVTGADWVIDGGYIS